MQVLRALLGLVLLASCGSAPPPSAAASSSASASSERPSSAGELSAALAPLAWWLGDWRAADGSSEHWVAAGGALYGVAFDGRGGFEVMIVDDAAGPGPADGKLRFDAMPGGEPEVRFDAIATAQERVSFGNAQNDFPKEVAYWRDGERLAAEISGEGRKVEFSFERGAYERGEALEAADLAFAADTAARGIDGWMAAFEPDGWQILGGKKASGDDIRRGMGPFLAQTKISWAPVASQRAGSLGFTVGKATFSTTSTGESWRGTYVTIWRQQPDGSWKVRFDTGRVVNEP